jgi:hypothetical protein
MLAGRPGVERDENTGVMESYFEPVRVKNEGINSTQVYPEKLLKTKRIASASQ